MGDSDDGQGKAMSGTGKARAERWRERRRSGLLPLMINVSMTHRRALERMGLILAGHDQDRAAITWAVERFLDTAPAVQAIGDALYQGAAEPFSPASEQPSATVLAEKSEDNRANA